MSFAIAGYLIHFGFRMGSQPLMITATHIRSYVNITSYIIRLWRIIHVILNSRTHGMDSRSCFLHIPAFTNTNHPCGKIFG